MAAIIPPLHGVNAIRYNDCPEAPAHTPLGHPHLIELRTFNHTAPATHLRLADGIATVLHNCADTNIFKAFFDQRTTYFELVRTPLEPGGQGIVIRRSGNKAMAGAFQVRGDFLGWQIYCQAEINWATGGWEDSVAFLGGLSRYQPPEDPEWNNPFGIQRYEEGKLAGGKLAWDMILKEVWRDDGPEKKLSWYSVPEYARLPALEAET